MHTFLVFFAGGLLAGALLAAVVFALRGRWRVAACIGAGTAIAGAAFILIGRMGGANNELVPIDARTLLEAHLPPVAGVAAGLVCGLALFSLPVVIRRETSPRYLGLAAGAALVCLLATSAGIRAFASHSAVPHDVDLGEVQRTLPPDLTVEVASSRRFQQPAALASGPDGELYVADVEGIHRLTDPDGDGEYDTVTFFAESLWPTSGLVFHDGWLYLAPPGQVVRVRDEDGDGRSDVREVLIEDLGIPERSIHSNNGLAFGPDGMLYHLVGAATDHGPETYEFGGTLLRMSGEPSGQPGGEPEIYARGFRNPYDMAFCADGSLWATDNGPDHVHEGLLFRPPDELNRVVQGGDYGFPDFFGYSPGWSEAIPPAALLPFSSASTGLLCYEGNALPETYSGMLFLTLWGSAVIPEETGRQLLIVRRGDPSATVEWSVTGWAHPIDLAEDGQGAILVVDFGDGRIFRIRSAE